MGQALGPDIKGEIEGQAAKVRRLAGHGTDLELDRLRDETAMLQALIAEAARAEQTANT